MMYDEERPGSSLPTAATRPNRRMVHVKISHVEEALFRTICAAGVPPEEAAIASKIYIEGELVQRESHGLRHLSNNLAFLARTADRRTPVALLNDTPASVLVDGGFHHPFYVHHLAATHALEKARNSGIALVSVRRVAGGSGVVGYYTRMLSEAGFIAVAMHTAPALVVAHGGRWPVLGTNPLSIAVPRRAHPPVVLDMATAVGTYNQLVLAQALGIELPPGVALDVAGRPTQDPAAALGSDGRARLLPFGAHKGFGLALMIEMLAAGSAGAILGDAWQLPEDGVEEFTGLYLAYRPDLFRPRHEFDATIEVLLARIQASEAIGEENVRLPGDHSSYNRNSALTLGYLEVEEWVYQMVRDHQLDAGAPFGTERKGGASRKVLNVMRQEDQ